jgi:hypothetical protein
MKSILIILLLPVFLHAQSEFMDSSKVGLKVSLAYSGNNNSSTFGGDAAASFLGIFDLGLQFANGDIANTQFKSIGNLFYFAINAKRGNNKNCIKILLGYMNETITSSYYRDIRVSGPVAGLDLFIKVSENEKVTVAPSIGILYGFLSVDSQGYYNVSGFDDARSVSLDLNLKFSLSNQFHLLFIPSISKDLVNSDNPVSFGLEIGLLLNSLSGN